MAVTRIKNNQITDLTVNAAAKLQDYTITSTKIANNLTYGSDLTIAGNLTVQGNTTTIDTVNLIVEDPLILLASEQTGSPSLDIGYIGKRGNEDNIAWIWDESADQFAAVFTSTEVTNTTVSISSYASAKFLDIEASNANISGNLIFNGTLVGNLDVTGNLTAGNVISDALVEGVTVIASGNLEGNNAVITNDISSVTVTASGNVSGANLTTAGVVEATGNVIGGNINTAGVVIATGNVTGGNIIATGNVDAGTAVNANLIAGAAVQIDSTGDIVLNPTGNIDVSGVRIRNMSDPELAFDAATKQYVDDSVSSGIHIHTPVDVETPVALPAATYNQGGTVVNVTDTIAGNTVVFDTAISPQVNDQLWFANSFEGIVANIAYFVVSAPNTSAAVLTTVYNGVPVSNITSNTGLTESVRVNSGYGANLTANATGALTVDGYSVSAGNRVLVYNQLNAVENGIYVVSDAGNGSASWVLTRSDDANSYIPDSSTGLDEGTYVYVKFGDTGAGESYVLTAPVGAFNIGQAAVTFTQFSASQVYSANTSAGLSLTGTVFSAKVDNDTTAFDGGGNIKVKDGANLVTPNIGDATGNSLTLSGNGLLSATTVSASGNVDGGNLNTTGTVVATGNVDGGNVNVASAITAGTTIDATGNITGGNVVTTGTADLGNIRITGNDITNFASNEITINNAGSDINVRIEGDNEPNLLIIDAGTDSVLIGTATPTTDAVLKIGTTDSMILPVGNTGQRPGTGVTGMIRFNTTLNTLEFYDADSWESAGTTFTIVTADSFTGDGSTLQFTLSEDSTTAATIVSINGVVQQPTTAYAVSGNVLTFTEAPIGTDVIDARLLTTTTTVTGIQNSSGNAVIEGSATSAAMLLTGDFLPTGNGVANIGSPTSTFNTIFATATSAQYADLAEMYAADSIIEPGTVVCFGGVEEITVCSTDGSNRIAGVVSTNPSYLMNSGLDAKHPTAVALTGRVPVKVTGTVCKGDMMVSAGDGRARAESSPAIGTVIGKALADFDGIDGVIEVVVGRI